MTVSGCEKQNSSKRLRKNWEEIMGWAVIAFVFISVLIIVRAELTYRHRIRAMGVDLSSYLKGPSYKAMMFDLRKWTFKQFYPQLAGRV